MRLPTGMGFEVDTDDEDSGLATFVDESNAVATVASKPSASRDDGEEPTYVTPTVVPPVEAPAMHVDAAHARVEPDPAPLLSPPMVAPTYPPAAPYAAPQQPPSPQPRPMPELAAGSSALRHDAMAARFGDASNVMATGRRGDTSDELLPARRKLPMPLIAGAGGVVAILLVVVIVLATRGGKSGSGGDKSSERATAKTVAAVDHGTKGSASEPGSATEPERPDPQSSAESGSNSVASTGTPPATGGKKPPTTGAGTGSGSEPPPPPVGKGSAATVAPTQIPSPPPAVARRPAQTLGGKKVVLEYDTTPPPKQPPKKVAAVSPAVVDENAVRAARTAYFNGNKKLFAGDANGAIKLYQQALNVYPGYVAGYRGLGLAYAQNGDKKNALKAFRTYMTAVPTAKDIALIKRRVATLQR